MLASFPQDTFHEILKDEYTVADKIRDIVERLKSQPRIHFSRLFRSAKNKLEAITTFLALLELVRQSEVMIEQDRQFGEIEITRGEPGKDDSWKPKI